MAGSSQRKTSEKSIEDIDFGAEIEMDSTAPLDKILKNLLGRERFSKAYKLYLQLLVQRRRVLRESKNLHYAVTGHPLKAFGNNWDGELKTGYFEAFQYKSTMPKIITQMKNIGKSDPVTDYMQVKSDWFKDIKACKRKYAGMITTKKLEKMNDDVVQCPKYMIDLAAKLEQDPYPNFDSSYNWHYAGSGNMQLICVAWVDYLLHSDHSFLYLTRLHKEDMSLDRETEANFDCEHDILETICSPQNIISLRTMNKVIILKIIEIDNHLYFDKLKEFDSEMPFTSISYDKFHKNMLYATRLDSCLSIVNLDRMKARTVNLQRQSKSNLNNWNCVIAGERSTYMHIEKRSISFYDKRTNGIINSWQGVRNIVDEVHCNDISAATRCDDSPSLYFATDHHLFLMDTRCGSSTKLRAAQRWTHGLQCIPTYMSVGKTDNNKEFIVISSQWCKDTCVVSNYADSIEKSCDIPGVSMPYHPPNIMDTVREARMQLLCLDLNNPIDSRLATSTTGLVTTEQGDNFAILTHNSLGDIMLRTLYPQYMESFVDDDSVQKLNDWCQSNKSERKDFEVSKITDISNVWKKLKKVPDDYVFGPTNVKELFRENEIYDAFENEEVIPELLDAWVSEREAPAADDSSIHLHLHYDDTDEGEP